MDNNFENFKLKVEQLVNQYNTGNFNFVIQKVNSLLKKQPNNQFILNLLGSSYHKIGNLNVAKKVFMRVIELDKNNLAAKNNLANVFKDLSEFTEAETLYKNILDINPNYINTIGNYGSLKFALNQYEESLILFKRALKIDNNSLIIHYNMGLVYQSLGQFEDAKSSFYEVLRINPNMHIVDRMMSRFIKYDKNNPHLIEMLSKINLPTLSDDSKINLNFALGKAYEDILNFEKSFFYLEQGNKIKNTVSKYNSKYDQQLFDNIIKVFKDYNFTKDLNKISDKQIIFIVGLPRSGTSLIEQIISAHSNVYGAGELDFLEKLMRINFFNDDQFKFLNLNDQSNIDISRKTSMKYLDFINKFNITESSITDKAPLNFRWIGFIKIFFPNAKVIHCVRDAKDNCMSLYKNIFDENQNWTYSQSNLFDYYKNYNKLMNFWKNKLPDFIYDCKYEDIINEPNIQIPELIKFCGLKWEKECMEFYNSKRAIKTVSVAQARKPLYKSSISSSKNFNRFLEDFFNKLDNLFS